MNELNKFYQSLMQDVVAISLVMMMEIHKSKSLLAYVKKCYLRRVKQKMHI